MVENAEKMDALFVNLVLLFKNAALQQMGKIMNPITGKIEKSMEQASFSVDMLEMLKGKTRGNLSEDLDRLLDSTLLELRMNYVEETEAAAKRAELAELNKRIRGLMTSRRPTVKATPRKTLTSPQNSIRGGGQVQKTRLRHRKPMDPQRTRVRWMARTHDPFFSQGVSWCCRNYWMYSLRRMSEMSKIAKDWLIRNFSCKDFFFLTGSFNT